MGKLIVTNWISLDGYIAGPDGEMDWILGDDEMSDYEVGMVTDADTLMLGRRTYQDFAGFWPKVPENPDAQPFEKRYAARINALRKVAVTTTLESSLWADTEFLRELTPESVGSIKSRSGGIVMYGSASVAQALTRLGLVDEYHLVTHPLALGGGKPLFAADGGRVQLERVRVEPFRSGVVLQVYRPAA